MPDETDQKKHSAALLRQALASHRAGRRDAAEAIYRQILAAEPGQVDALHLLGLILLDKGEPEAARHSIAAAVDGKPRAPQLHNSLGVVLTELGRAADAEAAFRRALELKPDFADAHNNLGTLYREQDRFDEAVECYREALALKPDYAEAHNNMGVALKDQGRYHEAEAALRRAIEIMPDYADAHATLSTILLVRGQLTEGWAEYEWRWQSKALAPLRRQHRGVQWDGGEIAGRTLLVHAEQGLGDNIQFVRYAPLAALRAGRVILECDAELAPLLAKLSGVDRLVARGEALPDHDVQAPLLGLPRLLGTTLDTVPAAVPYLHADPGAVARWRARLATGDGPAVGLVWGGNPQYKADRTRSIDLAALAPLADVDGVRLFSLQRGERAAEIERLGLADRIRDLDPDIPDLAERAAAIAALDLVISVDTAMAHLAGALGRPAWTLLQFVANWPWLLDRDDSPWYPTMRLFRQRRAGDWAEVIERVRAALARLAELRGHRDRPLHR